MIEKLHEECGVFGIYDTTGGDVAASTYFALYALQHRGQESCGIAVNDCGVISSYKDVGLVPDVFTRDHLEKVGSGQIAVGHVRYSTIGIPTREDSQPLVIRHVKGPMVVAHNGNLVNAEELKEELELKGAIFHTNSDAEIIAHVVTEGRLATDSIEKGIELAMDRLKGAYSMVMMSATKLIAVRDPEGFRPLCIGEKEGAIIFASETCALDSLGAKYLREVDPGEIVVVDKAGMRSIRTHCKGKGHVCVFEYVYFARPDSVVEGASVHEARQRAGAFLALESPVQADVVIGVPDSGLDAALGFSKQSGIPYGVGFIKTGMWAVLSSSPPRLCGKTRCGSSSTPSPQLSRANGWFWWTIPSSGAPPAPGLSSCCGRPAPPKSTCGSAPRPLCTPASSAPMLPAGIS